MYKIYTKFKLCYFLIVQSSVKKWKRLHVHTSWKTSIALHNQIFDRFYRALWSFYVFVLFTFSRNRNPIIYVRSVNNSMLSQ